MCEVELYAMELLKVRKETRDLHVNDMIDERWWASKGEVYKSLCCLCLASSLYPQSIISVLSRSCLRKGGVLFIAVVYIPPYFEHGGSLAWLYAGTVWFICGAEIQPWALCVLIIHSAPRLYCTQPALASLFPPPSL